MARYAKDDIKLRGATWQCNFHDRHTGEACRASLKTNEEEEARRRVLEWKQWYEDRATARKLSRPVPPRPDERGAIDKMSRMTLGDLCDKYLTAKHGVMSPKTLRSRIAVLLRGIPAKTALSAINQGTLREYIRVRERAPGKRPGTLLSPNSLNMELNQIRLMWNWATHQGIPVPPLDISRKAGIKVKKRRYEQPLLTEGEMVELREMMDADLRQVFDFAFLSTTRQMNCLTLRKDQIVWDARGAAIYGSFTVRQKGDRPHTVPMDQTLRAIVETACAQTTADCPYVFTYVVTRKYRANGRAKSDNVVGRRQPWTASSFRQRWKEARLRAGINKPWHPVTRAGGITRIAGVAGVVWASKIAGHANIEQTMTYFNGSDADMLRALTTANADLPWQRDNTQTAQPGNPGNVRRFAQNRAAKRTTQVRDNTVAAQPSATVTKLPAKSTR